MKINKNAFFVFLLFPVALIGMQLRKSPRQFRQGEKMCEFLINEGMICGKFLDEKKMPDHITKHSTDVICSALLTRSYVKSRPSVTLTKVKKRPYELVLALEKEKKRKKKKRDMSNYSNSTSSSTTQEYPGVDSIFGFAHADAYEHPRLDPIE